MRSRFEVQKNKAAKHNNINLNLIRIVEQQNKELKWTMESKKRDEK